MRDTWPYWSVAALATSNSFHLAGPDLGCGQCFQIQCINDGPTFTGKCHDDWQSNSITVMITDECPECAPDQIDVQALSFDKIAPLINGRIQTQYRRVTCTPPDATWVRIDGNNGPGLWLRLWIVNVAGSGGVTSVSIRGPDQVQYPMTNTFGAAWEIGSAPQFPADLVVSTDDSQQIILLGAVTEGQTGYVQTAIQFISTPTAWPTAPVSLQKQCARCVQPLDTQIALIIRHQKPPAESCTNLHCFARGKPNKGLLYACMSSAR